MSDTKVPQSTANAAKGSLAYELTKQVNTSRNAILTDPGLAIKASSSALAKHANTIYAIVDGVLVKKTTGDMPAIAGTIPTDTFGLFVWVIESSGTLSQLTVAKGATLADIVLPDFPVNKTVVGALIIAPTGTGDFVGGTTALDDATVVPAAVYLDGNDIGGALGNRVELRTTGIPD